MPRRTGPRIGGLLNATFGTLTEFIVMFALLRAGHTDLLKASIVGSILISLLLTLGAAILFGGIRNGMQRFDQQSVGHGHDHDDTGGGRSHGANVLLGDHPATGESDL